MVKRVVEEKKSKGKKKAVKQSLSVKKIIEKTEFPKEKYSPKKKKEVIKKETPGARQPLSVKKIIEKTIFPTKRIKTIASSKQKTVKKQIDKSKLKTQAKKTIQKPKIVEQKKKPEAKKQANKPKKQNVQIKKLLESKDNIEDKAKALLEIAKNKVIDNSNVLKIIIICLVGIILILSLVLIITSRNKSSYENIVILNNSEKSIQEETKDIQEEIKTENLNQTDEIIQIEPEPPKEVLGQLKRFNLIVNTTTEEIILESNHKKLNLFEKIVDVYRENIRKKELPLFLNDLYSTSKDYSQEIILSDKLLLHDFENDNYINYVEGEEATGFVIPDDLNVFVYRIKFEEGTLWSDLDRLNIKLFGKNYQILYTLPEEKKITLLENPLHFNMNKKDVVTIETLTETENISVYFMGNNEAILNISGKKTNKLSKGSEFFTDKFYFYTKDIIGIDDDSNGLISMIVSDKVLVLEDRVKQRPSIDVYDLLVDINSTDEYIYDISISWIATQDMFLTSDTSMYLPYFNTIKMYMSDEYDMDPDEENSHYYSNYWEVFLEAKSETFEWMLNQTNLESIQTELE